MSNATERETPKRGRMVRRMAEGDSITLELTNGDFVEVIVDSIVGRTSRKAIIHIVAPKDIRIYRTHLDDPDGPAA